MGAWPLLMRLPRLFLADGLVLDGGRVVGRIFLHAQGPQGTPWFWTITAPDTPPSVDKRGYSATREEAMTDFKARWIMP